MRLHFGTRHWGVAAVIAIASASALAQTATAARSTEHKALIERGRYLVQIAGCNDCHTPGYGAANGKVDEKLWLTGDSVGWSGPWGTTYATNLRLYMKGQTEASWLKTARSFEPRPPMPWFNVRAMSERDLRSLYRYISSLEPVGGRAPDYLPPAQKPKGPAIQFPG
jgi:mono/diheme cytochrome c family protein